MEKKVLASQDEIFIPAPRTSSGERKKITASTSTPLSRMLASQKGSKKHSTAESEDGSAAESDEDKPPAEQGQDQKSRKTKTPVSDAPLDPSIMGSAFGSGRGKKAEKDEEQEIAWLEWKLGKKGAKKPVAAEEGDESDGLDGESDLNLGLITKIRTESDYIL